METKIKKTKQTKDAEIVREVWEDFRRRKEERRAFDAQWQLNINFVMGNHFCDINSSDVLRDIDRQYFWEEREVYNHIAPIVETRIAKLSSVRPSMTVLPATSDQEDISNARVSKDILESLIDKLDFSKKVSQATHWSEVCGTVFYKVIWNDSAGAVVGLTPLGDKIFEGDVDILVCPPFEIYPDSNTCADVTMCRSIIHARSYSVDTIEQMWGIKVPGSDIDTFALSSVHANSGESNNGGLNKVSSTIKHNQAMVLEKYEMPSKEFPEGRLVIVLEDKLVFDGELPYKNLKDGERGLPFIRQISSQQPSLFWGSCMVDRIIPIQRAFNAVKNRKHEFINRLSMGVLTVEDGSIDVEQLQEEGISPGKILVYRQGSNVPRMLTTDSVPAIFGEEEQRLLNEFLTVSGVSDLLNSTNSGSIANMSGIALQLLIDQEQARISASAEYIRFGVKELAQHILRLYKQFATHERVGRIVGSNGAVNFFYWERSNISSDDIAFDTENEMGQTVSQKRNMMLDILNRGLLHDENGKLSNSMRQKALEMLGFGIWEDALDNETLQLQKAKRENLSFVEQDTMPEVLDIHDHDLHIQAHTSFMLSGDFEKEAKKRSGLQKEMLEHVHLHKQFKKLEARAENL